MNSKSSKERHDTAYWAWDASVKLAVAASPPSDPEPLARGSIGHWVRALAFRDTKLTDEAIIGCYYLFTGKKPHPSARLNSISPRELLDPLPAYRNETIGHGSVRTLDYYEDTAGTLLSGLEAAWNRGVFFPPGSRLVYAESVELDPSGVPRARLLDLTGELGHIIDPKGTPGIPTNLLPKRLYLRTDGDFRALHPWLLFHESELVERVFFFNRLARSPQYLDYASGEILKGLELRKRYPSVDEDIVGQFKAPAEPRDESAAPVERTGTPFGDFCLLRKLGAGGMGVVHLARQESLGRLVAIKMLPPAMAERAAAVTRFKQEIAALGRCEHPNVVKILTSGKVQFTHYYAMEYVEGVNLSELGTSLLVESDFDSALAATARTHSADLDSRAAPPGERSRRERASARLPSPQVVRSLTALFADAAQGIGHLHENGVIHRDIKPSNLMLTLADHRTVVMDLGLAKVRESTQSITLEQSRTMGTLRYTAPEQLHKNLMQVDHRADIYALGASFYELMCGRPVFSGDTEARLVEQILHENPLLASRSNPAIGRDLATILGKALEKDRNLRYQDADTLVSDLEALLQNRPISARRPTFFYLLKLAVARNRAMAVTLAASILVVLALLVLFAWSQRQLARTETVARKNAELAREEIAYRLDVSMASNLLNEANRPARLHPDSLPDLQRWISSAEGLVKKLEHYRELDAVGKTPGRPAVASPREIDELRATVARVERNEETYLPRFRSDSLLARNLEAVTIENEQPAWKRAIRDVATCESYGGRVRIRPQLGLVPIHKNPRSRLWEFWHVASGERPEVDPANGQLILAAETGIVLVLVPGGTFLMGSPPQEPGRDLNERLHKVTLAPFFVGKYEVTQAQWQRAMFENPSYYPPGTVKGTKETTETNPVEGVSWLACQDFVYRLALSVPTEAQWEYAARAGTRSAYLWGETGECFEGRENLRDMSFARETHMKVGAAPWDDGHAVHASVGAFVANPFGLYDIQGNVGEWTADVYCDEYPADSRRPGDGLSTMGTGDFRVFRGATWYLPPVYGRSALRHFDGKRGCNASRGLRVARYLDP